MEAVYVDRIRPCTHYNGMNTSKPPILIAFASSKGGAGKSTNCVSVAGALTAMGHKVHLVDCDHSETVWRWYNTNPSAQGIEGMTAEKAPPAPDGDAEASKVFGDFMKKIVDNEEGRDFVLFDLAGHLTKNLLYVATLAHLVITPAKVSEPDIVLANLLYQQLVEIGVNYGKAITHRILINEYPNAVSNDDKQIMEQISSSILPVFKTIIRRRAAYTASFNKGITPHYAARPDPAAIQEIDSLVDEIYAAIFESGQQAHQQREEIAA